MGGSVKHTRNGSSVASNLGAGAEAVKEVIVKPDEFEMYCLQLGQIPNYSVLEALAAKKAREAT